MRTNRVGVWVAAGAASAAIVGIPAARATVLSGMMQFSSNAMGSANGAGQWNTLGGDASSNLWVLDPTAPPSGFHVNGPTDAAAGISILLAPGAYMFDIYGEPGADPSGFSTINLFFNGNTTNPGITALRHTGFPPVSTFGSTFSGATLSLAGASTTGAGSLVFNDGSNIVTLTEYWWALSGPSASADIGSAFTETPNAVNDFFGRVEFTVEAVPAPGGGVGGLAACAFFAVARSRRRKS